MERISFWFLSGIPSVGFTILPEAVLNYRREVIIALQLRFIIRYPLLMHETACIGAAYYSVTACLFGHYLAWKPATPGMVGFDQ